MKADAATAGKKPENASAPAGGEVKEFKKNGIFARIRPTIKDGVTRFVVDYRSYGQANWCGAQQWPKLAYFNRWLVLCGYLAKRTDSRKGVQKYTKRKLSEISTYTVDEMRRLIGAADERILPMIVIGGIRRFASRRDCAAGLGAH